MTNRVPYTVPPEISFPEPLTNPSDPRLKHRFQPWEGQEADVVVIDVSFIASPKQYYARLNLDLYEHDSVVIHYFK